MILGLLSDTHGHGDRTEKALALLRGAGAEHLIHCGDLGGEEILSLLLEEQENGTPVTAVPGNVDEWDPGLLLYGKKIGIPLPRVHRLILDGMRIAVHHGHDPALLQSLSVEPDLDLLFTGHTHVAKDERCGPLRIINPGAVYRARPPGVSVLDTRTGELRFFPLGI
ncbi:MAG: metallophosphoesterase family protein [Kiritimatiellia bacterium]